MPIYEWQGVLFVGCLQPPTDFPKTAEKVVFVLCEPKALQEIWYEFQGTVVADRKPALPPSMKTKDTHSISMDLSNFKLEVEPAENEPALDFSLDSPLDSDPMEETRSDEPSLMELSAELDHLTEAGNEPLPAHSAHAELSNDDLNSFEPLVEPVANVTDLLQDGLEAESAFDSTEESADESVKETNHEDLLDLSTATAPITLQPLGNSALKIPEPVEAPESMELTMDDLEKTKASQKAEKFPPKPAAPKPASPAQAKAKTSPEIEKRAHPTKTEILLSSVSSEITRTATMVLNSTPADQLDSWVQEIFKEMGQEYKKSMILLKSGDQIKPWKWDANFVHDSTLTHGYPLHHASPFRIALRTQKPYHGYVIQNDLVTKFFSEWNGAQIPTHLTIVPIVIDDHVIGMLLGIGEKTAEAKTCLQMVEKLAGQISKRIKDKPETLKVA